jgi:hypothetical protein
MSAWAVDVLIPVSASSMSAPSRGSRAPLDIETMGFFYAMAHEEQELSIFSTWLLNRNDPLRGILLIFKLEAHFTIL